MTADELTRKAYNVSGYENECVAGGENPGTLTKEDLMGMFSLIRSDVRAKAQWVYGSVSHKSILKALLTDGTFAMIVYRLMQASQRLHLVPLAMLFNKLNAFFGRCIIGRNASFGPGFVLIHSYGVVINSSVSGGSGVKIEHQVTIGAEKDKAPVLGNNVFVGAGAKVLGSVRIGNDAKIGANAVVVNDVPDGATAVGVPARVVGREGVCNVRRGEGDRPGNRGLLQGEDRGTSKCGRVSVPFKCGGFYRGDDRLPEYGRR